MKIGIVVSHPVQHFCPQYVSFAENKNTSLKVFFGSVLGYKKYIDINFKQEIAWGNLHLDKFSHIFLNGETLLQPGKDLDAPTLERELSEFNPDLLITYGYFQKLQRRARRWALKNNTALAYISDSETRQQRTWLKELLKVRMLRQYFRPFDYFLTVGDANEEYYRKYGVPAEKMLRMHFPIDIKQYSICYNNRFALRQVCRTEYNISDNETVLLVVGKLSPWKNQDHIIEAMYLLEKEGIILHLLVLGSGEMKEVWQEKALRLQKSKVYFPGFIPIEKLPGYYAAADIYVHPAAVEPHSIAVSEAIYMGCPVIISDRCGSYGQNDDVQEGINGNVFEFGNITQLAEIIKSQVQSGDKREKMSAKSHAIAVDFQENAHHTIIEKLMSAYKSSCNKP